MQASNELDKSRKTPEQKAASSTTVLVEEHLSFKEQVGGLTEQLQLLTTSSEERGAASSAEICGMADAHGKNTVISTMSSKEMRLMDEQVRCSTAGPGWTI